MWSDLTNEINEIKQNAILSKHWTADFCNEQNVNEYSTAQSQSTGIFDDLRKTSNASSEPSVDAWTNTPRSCTLMESRTSASICDSSSYTQQS